MEGNDDLLRRYCSRGHPLTPGAQFCSTCGEPITAGAAFGQEMRDKVEAVPSDPALQTQGALSRPAIPPAEPGVVERPSSGRRSIPWFLGALALIGAGAVVVVATGLLGDVGGLPFGKQELRGIAVLYSLDGSMEGSWDSCQGTGGYSDFDEGMNLSIRGREDEIVGSGTVRNVTEELLPTLVELDWKPGNFVGLDETEDREAAVDELRDLLEETEGVACWLYISADLEDSDYYSIELGRRGSLDYSRDELAEKEYVVSFDLGDL